MVKEKFLTNQGMWLAKKLGTTENLVFRQKSKRAVKQFNASLWLKHIFEQRKSMKFSSSVKSQGQVEEFV